MTKAQKENWIKIIDGMSHYQMIQRLRSKMLHPILADKELSKLFMDRLNKLGGVNYTKEEDDLVSRRVDEFVKTGTYH